MSYLKKFILNIGEVMSENKEIHDIINKEYRKVAFSPSAIFSLDKLDESVCAEKH